MENKKEEILKQYFGYDKFRNGQDEVIDNILSKRDVMCIMPTGAGKSICYQVPALMFSGITIVVSPLISLMKDQVQFLLSCEVKAAYINSSLSPKVIEKVFERVADSWYKIIYVAPERLNTLGFLNAIKKLNVSLLVVDEAHCISRWGHDFRPSYLEIIKFIDNLSQRPVIGAFTATATNTVREDICNILGLRSPFIKITSFDRPNLFFDVKHPRNKDSSLLYVLRNRSRESGIVYCATRKNVEEICKFLTENGFSATRYHAGLDEEEKAKNQDDFIFDTKRIMVATNAFGMGVDKSNVSFVIHYNMPKDMESYYQEAGRAGRDGNKAECILLYNEDDIRMNKFLIRQSENEELSVENQFKLLSRMVDYCKTGKCLRGFILDYFGERHPTHCGYCGNCNDDERQLKLYIRERKKASKRGKRSEGTNISDTLFSRLKRIRFEISQREKISIYTICSDMSLSDMALRKPQTKEEFLNVADVSQIQCDLYCDDFILEIKRYLKQKNR